jgi:hypothetical protein
MSNATKVSDGQLPLENDPVSQGSVIPFFRVMATI